MLFDILSYLYVKTKKPLSDDLLNEIDRMFSTILLQVPPHGVKYPIIFFSYRKIGSEYGIFSFGCVIEYYKEGDAYDEILRDFRVSINKSTVLNLSANYSEYFEPIYWGYENSSEILSYWAQQLIENCDVIIPIGESENLTWFKFTEFNVTWIEENKDFNLKFNWVIIPSSSLYSKIPEEILRLSYHNLDKAKYRRFVHSKSKPFNWNKLENF
uniref:Uncharacterized protein n=1 Tax=Promethearchaeum syntrophicum TaxID=2594042 RepID=A0A5B9DEM7_9ARCH|nr:hypothetical protein [Candidatus Prometheoarchaeum syntrophicum]QEE17769.1 hypothetical protein DSAG12_03607 [Candidatus Prometheoarchaeum syntrophicum]